LLAVVVVAIQLVPRAPAQKNAGNQTTVGSVPQIPAVSREMTSAVRSLPVAGCPGWAALGSVQ